MSVQEATLAVTCFALGVFSVGLVRSISDYARDVRRYWGER